jgi:hypothetical protein
LRLICVVGSYTSIPQRSKPCQRLSIDSLPAYTSFARFFLIVAPTATVDGKAYDLATYQKRGWCRLEQWARVSQRGLQDLYLCDGSADSPAKDVSDDVEFLTQAMEFMHGDYTASDARANLVDASLMLYSLLLSNSKQGSGSSTLQKLVTQCKARRDELYPVELFEDLMSIVEQHVETGKAIFARRASLTPLEGAAKSFKRSITSTNLPTGGTGSFKSALHAAPKDGMKMKTQVV